MKKIIAALTAVAAVTVIAAPAAAQSYDRGYQDRGHHDRGWNDGGNINQRQERLDRMIDRGLRSGALSHREARRLRGEFRDIARLEARYRYDGLSRWERADLDRRFDRLEAQIRYERRDRQYGSRW